MICHLTTRRALVFLRANYFSTNFVMQGNKLYKNIEGGIFEAHNQVVQFWNNSQKLHLHQLVKVQGVNAIVLSIQEKSVTALVLKADEFASLPVQEEASKDSENEQLETEQNHQNIAVENTNQSYEDQLLTLDTSIGSAQNSILNYRGQILKAGVEQAEDTSTLTLPIYKQQTIKAQRIGSLTQLFSGNLVADYTRAIAKGQFVIVKGESGTGKTYFAQQTMLNFALKRQETFDLQPGSVPEQSPRSTYCVYVSLDPRSAAETHSRLASDSNETNKLPVNFTCFTVNGDTPNIAESFFVPFSALRFANELRDRNYDVLLVFDTVLAHREAENQIYAAGANLPFAPLDIFKEIFASCGNFEGKFGSLTALLLFDTNKGSLMQSTDIQKIINEAESYADNILPFQARQGASARAMRLMPRPKLDFASQTLALRQKYTHPLLFLVQERLVHMLCELKKQRDVVSLMHELKIQVDPWDFFLYHDAKYFEKLLHLERYFQDPVEALVYLSFVLRAVEEEITSQFKDAPNVLMHGFLDFCRDFRDIEEEQQDTSQKKNIFEYVHDWLRSKDGESARLQGNVQTTLPDNPLNSKLYEYIKRMYDLYLMHLKMNDRLHPFKEDYFK